MEISWANFADVAWLTAAAAGLVKILDVTFKYLHDRQKLDVSEEINGNQTEQAFRKSLIDRIAALEAAEVAEGRRVQLLERKLTRVIGMLVLFRLCPNKDCPIVDSLRRNGDIAWLDEEILERSKDPK